MVSMIGQLMPYGYANSMPEGKVNKSQLRLFGHLDLLSFRLYEGNGWRRGREDTALVGCNTQAEVHINQPWAHHGWQIWQESAIQAPRITCSVSPFHLHAKSTLALGFNLGRRHRPDL